MAPEGLRKRYPSRSVVDKSKITLLIGRADNAEEYEAPRSIFANTKRIRAMIDDWEKSRLGPAVVCLYWGSDTEALPAYLHWLQHREALALSDFSATAVKGHPRNWMRLYIWGSFVQDEIYQDVMISRFIDCLAKLNRKDKRTVFIGIPPNLVSALYEHTSNDSPMRKLLIYAITALSTEEDWTAFKKIQGFPNQFVMDMVASASKALAVSGVRSASGSKEAKLVNPDKKSVRFWDEQEPLTFTGTTAEEMECTYHFHVKTGSLCWRKLKEFNP